MPVFDGNAYRKKVLARLVVDFSVAHPETGDPFFVFDLDPDSDQATVLTRIGDVVAFWQKERNSIKYKGVAGDLVAARARYEAVLTHPARRAAAAVRVQAQRAAADAERFADLDRLAGQLAERFGGIPVEKVDQLQLLARRSGTDDAGFAAWLSEQRVLAADEVQAEPWEPAIRRQIRSQLTELARHSGEPGRYATLWTFLDLSPHSSDAQLSARHAELLAANQGARHDSAKTRTGELLAQVKTRLLAEGGRDAYAASLRAEATDLIYQDVAEKALVAGEVTAADYETLVQRVIALDWGISNHDARAAVRSAATALGASLAVAPAVDYLICGHCRAPQASPPPAERSGARCRYCAEALYLTCPNCARLVETAAATCPDCGTSFTAYREVTARLGQARTALAAGHPRAAQELLNRSRTRTGVDGSVDGVDLVGAVAGSAELATAIAAALQSARTEWQALEQDIAAGRIWGAYDRASRLHRIASDVPGPGGVAVDQRRAELATVKAEIQIEVRATATLPPAEAETALARLQARAVDGPEVIAALAAIPLAAPTGLRVRITQAGVSLAWRPAPVPGPVSYRVVRLTTPTGSASSTGSTNPGTPTTIGTTSATALEDAGAPGGIELVYQVSAVAGRRSSIPLISQPVLMIRDITAVRAEESTTGVLVTWSGSVGGGTVVIERSTDQAALKRRIRPDQPDQYLDPDVVPGPTYGYRVFVEYRRSGAAPVVTDGRSVSIRVRPRPVPVKDLWARTELDHTVLNFSTPPDGRVQIYAGSGELAEPGRLVDEDQLAALAARARLVGSARRRLIDRAAVGRIRYTPVTVVEGRGIVGTGLDHLAIGRVSNVTAVDHGDRLLLNFDLPRGATEAMIRWRFGEPPSGLDDSTAGAAKVTNAKLEIAGGFELAVPNDGRAVHVAVYPAVRVDGRLLTAGPVPATLQARAARPLEIRYQVQRTGLLRRALRVDIDAGADVLPPVVLVVRPGEQAPTSPAAGEVLGRAGGDGRSNAVLELPLDRFPAGVSTFRVLLASEPDRPTQVFYPDPADLSVSR